MRRLVPALLAASVVTAVPDSAAPAFAGTGAPPLMAYRGLGTWVDIYETWVWNHPKQAARQMDRKGVRTLYLETSNYSRTRGILYPDKARRLINAAHDRGMKVVAWYLPGFDDVGRDLARSIAAIELQTGRGDRFDSFALDIEASIVTPPWKRTKRLLGLSRQIRAHTGDGYPLGAIIPSPKGMQLSPGYWPGFPYQRLAGIYDVFVPMGYYSYRTQGPIGAHDYTVSNVKIIRSKTGSATMPIHVIGGIANASTGPETRSFVRACREHGVLGCSLYKFTLTGTSDWGHLATMPVNPRQIPSLPVKIGFAEPLGNIPGVTKRHPKEVFYRAAGRPGVQVLQFDVWDAGLGEVEVWLNWKKLADVEPTLPGSWSGPRTVVIPDARFKDSKRNYIQFVAAGGFPEWSEWGVQAVDLL
ncbi:MAG TPA: hypothetical protein VHL78_02880 [Actinomycetota bacterium]|nr:hypothetical protein [Actinomycetota bacterium]